MQGFATQFAFWRESDPLGAQTGTAYRMPGINDVSWQSEPAATWQVRDPLYGQTASSVIMESYRITLSREVKHSAYDSLWLEALTDGIVTTAADTDSRALIDNVEAPTFGCEFTMDDGAQKRFIGMGLSDLEWTIESGRLVREQATFVALQCTDFVGSVRDVTFPQGTSLGGLQVRRFMKVGTAWTGADMTSDPVTSISGQVIFQRTIDAGQWDVWGKATRLSYKGGWDIVGRDLLQVPTMWGALFSTASCLYGLRVGTPSNFISVEAQVSAKLSRQPIITGGQYDHSIDWAILRNGRSLVTLKKYVQP